MNSNDTLFEVTIEQLYHAAALSNADIIMGNYADLVDGQFYFYSFGDGWKLHDISISEYLQRNATWDPMELRVYGSIYGRLYRKQLFNVIEESNLAELNWRLALNAKSISYLNYPSYVYCKRTVTVQSYYEAALISFQQLMKEAQKIEGFSLDEAKQNYCQLLANFVELLKSEGAIDESKRVYQMLVTAERGIIPLLDLPSTNFTIISDNCIAGVIYQQLGLPYLTPFVGLFILPEDYYKLTKNLYYYMSQEILFDEELAWFSKGNYYYPVGHLGDVTIHFLHYKTNEEARSKWNRRKNRMNWSNIYFKFDNNDSPTKELLQKIDRLPYHNKIILVHRDLQLINQVIIPSDESATEVGWVDDPLQKFDVIKWLKNGGNDLSVHS